MARNDITNDLIANTKGSAEKYAQGWDAIFKPKRDIFAELQEGLDVMARTYKPVSLEASLCVACGEPVIYLEELKHSSIHCPHCDNEFSVYCGDSRAGDTNPQDDALFADMHVRKEQFSTEAVAAAFMDVPRRVPNTAMALDFHDSRKGLTQTTCFVCGHCFEVYPLDTYAQCPECHEIWEQD